ncbi:MAG: phosphoribosylglycinamide formyltransferase [Solobacterium sp.]|jgi:phosphoribosylglycinamide formyltransferase-1|nr:phosphoribosylglycinamide formyltransferase [Solobacterium sp.]MCH4205896.1 phosphoribosylglycinamide formyltransferase [Solobacterium sp.]MCH4227319.1 phosphoribosylglycinamide formyltransferase [Solobacterium sp.]MCH4282684.1 phosphoribosylglycinamide formyltransferase [Solobacterium sp.]
MIRIAVLVSGGGTNLQALIDAENAGKIPHGKISLVLASNDKAYALERAKKAAIPAISVKRKDYASQEEFDQALIASLHAYKIDMVILAGYLSILGTSVIDAYRDRMINIHPSLIPSFCGKGFYGLHVHEAALARGVKVTGATVHYVNEIPDGGKIILQKAVEIQEGDTPEILQKRVMEQAEWILLPKAAEMVAEKIAEEKAE